VVLYWFENWFLTLREKYKPRVFENRFPRGTFEQKRNEVPGVWRKLYRINILGSKRWKRHVARMRAKKGRRQRERDI
jgi:hypothetical protein